MGPPYAKMNDPISQFLCSFLPFRYSHIPFKHEKILIFCLYVIAERVKVNNKEGIGRGLSFMCLRGLVGFSFLSVVSDRV